MTSKENKDKVQVSQFKEEPHHPLSMYLNAVVNYMEDAIFVKDSQCRLLIVNDAFCTIFGLSRNEIIGKTLAEKVAPNEREHFLSVDRQVLREGTEVLCEETLTVNGGAVRTIITRKNRFIDPQGDYFLVGVIHDITESKLIEEKLKISASVFTHAHEGIMITDAEGSIIDVNDCFTSITGYSREEALGKNPRFLRSGRQSPAFYVDMWKMLIAKGFWSGELWNRNKKGELYAEMLNISSVKDVKGQISNYIALFNDITPMKEHQRQIEHIAHYDTLTNLPNRSLLSDRLSQAMLQCNRHDKPLAVVFLDLDGFKDVNDTYGHAIGDDLLVAISQRMKEAIRGGDTLARIGGDEFVAVLTDLVSVEDCQPILERLLLAASEPVILGEIVLKVSASIGVTLYPQDSSEADILLRHADQAMYAAKESGKNRYHLFDTAHHNTAKI